VIRVAYQGEPGAYGEEACLRFFGADTVDPRPMPTFSAVYDSVASGATDAGVLPLENSLAGTVGDALDALATGSLTVIGEVLQPIHHQLLVVPGVPLSEVEHVTSHWQALSQCDRFLSQHGWHVIPAADTAGAARRLAEDRDPHVAVIASERAAHLYGLEVAAHDIEDASHNVTRFAVISGAPRERGRVPAETGTGAANAAWESLITFETWHRPGDLVRALSVLASAGINLSRIESRPSGDGPWRYRFLVQVEGDADVEPLRTALTEMRAHTRSIRVLGSFVAG
jgi:prephenate dehydratase